MAPGLRISPELKAWLDSGVHLPDFLRDFHDAKDFFKALHTLYSFDTATEMKDITWIQGQIYSVDFLLRFLATHGYTLQKNRTKLDFLPVHETVEGVTRERQDNFTSLLLGAMAPKKV